MEDIKINSVLDLRTYFNISMLTQLKTRTFVRMLIYFALMQVCFFYNAPFNWTSEIYIISFFVIFYGIVIPLLVYFGARRNMSKIIALGEPKVYTINNEQIALQGETVSATVTWAHIAKFIEREKYFILMPPSSAFYYFPKAGFQSEDDITRLKNLVKEKDIKMSYH